MRLLQSVFSLAACGAVLLALEPDVAAQDSGLGVGLIVGDPTGLSLKGFLNDRIALDGAIGLGFLGGDHFYAHADFLWNQPLRDFDRARMLLHFGVGPKLGLAFGDDALWVGARAPLGLTFAFGRVPIDVFVEAAAGLWIVPATDFDLDVAGGARWFF